MTHPPKQKNHPKHPAAPAEKKHIADLMARIGELEHGWKRTQADFENFRRHADEKHSEIARFGRAEVLLKLVPILDNFRRAAEHVPAEQRDSEWVKGVQLIEKQLEAALLEEGLKPIEVEGEFNPRLHEAISHESHPSVPENHIIAVSESGWRVGERVLKPAKVRVSSGPGAAETESLPSA